MTSSVTDSTAVSAVKSLTSLIRAECAGVDKTRVIPVATRSLRDARTAAQHICLHQANFEIGGRQMVGGSVIPGICGMDYRGEV